jgi:predicted DNA-binding transcriptional regulator YafY
MLETSARLLRLLSLLQAHREWSGADLADRLGVTPRTVRRDVDRLRELGYPVHSARGTAGGYRLGAGAQLPPLLLDDEEAVAVAVGLRQAAGGVEGIEETSVRALAKLEQVLPDRLRRRVSALSSFTVPMPGTGRGPSVDPAVLIELAGACRDAQRLRFTYRDHGGTVTRRTAEPHRLVAAQRRWYLVAWDVDRDDWRTYRADRITPTPPHGPRFTPRRPPADDLAEYVSRGVSKKLCRGGGQEVAHSSERPKPHGSSTSTFVPYRPSSRRCRGTAASSAQHERADRRDRVERGEAVVGR